MFGSFFFFVVRNDFYEQQYLQNKFFWGDKEEAYTPNNIDNLLLVPIQDGVYAYLSVCVYITIYIINYYLYYKYICRLKQKTNSKDALCGQ